MRNTTTSNQYFTLEEAAEFLGVTKETVRRWVYTKKLEGSNIGDKDDWRLAEADLLGLAISDTKLSQNNYANNISQSTADWPINNGNAHFVQFYEDDAYLVRLIRDFIKSGDSSVIVVNKKHKTAIEAGLTLYGLDLKTVTKSGSYVCLDARETLSKFMRGNMPDKELFFSLIGKVITRSSKNKKNIRVFGEMVALLWAAGNQQGAIRLEELWNELQMTHKFSLFCAYPLNGFEQYDHRIPFERISLTHSHVYPSESYSSISDEPAKLREIALLQQKALALQAEINNHKKTNEVLLQTIEKLNESEEFNKRIMENSADCIKALDINGNLLTMNQPGCKVFEIEDISQYIGKSYLNFWKDNAYLEAKNAVQNACDGNVGRFQGFCPTAKGTPKWWDVVITPMYDGNQHIDRLLVISRDITSFKELEQRKDDFLSATSHELKTPLTSQKAFIQLLQKQLVRSNEDNYLHFVEKIGEQTNKLTKLVIDLLDVSKIQGGKLELSVEKFDLNDCIKKTVEEVQPILEQHEISVVGHISMKVAGDKERISQVLTNLLTNAAKYSPKATRIKVKVEMKGSKVIVSVKDKGIGIDKVNQKKIFGRFFRVEDNNEKTYPGLGMGLYISSEIIKQHQGQISVQSIKGKGSIFSFSLPLN